jgi:hypothetical protein
MRYLNKKWKMMHIKLVSNCFAVTQTDVMDDWLTNDPDILPNHPPEIDSPEDVLNDSTVSRCSPQVPPTAVSGDLVQYEKALISLDFTNGSQVEEFCRKFSESNFFCGSKNFDDFLMRNIGI